MTIRNEDGTPYEAIGSLQQFDPENPEHCLFNLWDSELIRIAGSPIFYYEVFIQVGSLDKLYKEDRGKIWSNLPVQLYALYEPVEMAHVSTEFGIDGLAEVIFELNFREVIDILGHHPKVGARIDTPHKGENWVIVDVITGEHKLWGEIRMKLLCQRFQETVTTGEGKITQKKPDFKIN